MENKHVSWLTRRREEYESRLCRHLFREALAKMSGAVFFRTRTNNLVLGLGTLRQHKTASEELEMFYSNIQHDRNNVKEQVWERFGERLLILHEQLLNFSEMATLQQPTQNIPEEASEVIRWVKEQSLLPRLMIQNPNGRYIEEAQSVPIKCL